MANVNYARPQMTDLLSQLQSQQDSARSANQQRYSQAQGIYDRIIKMYEPGGGFGQGFEAQLGRTRTKTMASGMQNLVSSGLANTTMAATLGGKFAEEVEAPARLQLEDLRTSKLSEVLQSKAGMIERVSDTGPDAGMVAALSQQVGQASPTTEVIRSEGWNTWGNSPWNRVEPTPQAKTSTPSKTRTMIEPGKWVGSGSARYYQPAKYGYK